MTEDQYITLDRIPARLTGQMVGWELKLRPEDLNIPEVRRLVPALNDFGKGVVRYWAAVEILAIKQDRARLVRITRAVYTYWRNRNSRRKNGVNGGLEE